MLRVQDPYLKPMKELLHSRFFKTSPYGFFEVLLSLLVNKSSHKEILTKFVVNELNFTNSIHKEPIAAINKILTNFDFSLNERFSETHITLFHLSMIMHMISERKQKGQFFTPSYLSNFISRKVLDFFSSNCMEEKNDLLKMNYGDIACGTGNLLLSLIYEIYGRMRKTELSEGEFSDFISNNISGYDLDELSLKISKLRIFFFLSEFSHLDRLPDFSSAFVQCNSLISSDCCFTDEDNLLLRPLDINRKGCYVLLSYSSTENVRELYKDFEEVKIWAKRYIDSKPEGGKGVQGLLIINF